MAALASTVKKRFRRLKPNKTWSFRDAKRSEMHAHTHGYHRYPAKFIPQLVQKLLRVYAPRGREVVCDPFGGCGTTLVESKLSGRKSIGFDINPVAKLITLAKVTAIKPVLLEKYRRDFLLNYRRYKGRPTKHSPRIYYWFDTKTVAELDRIFNSIKLISNQKVKRFFLCAFSHNLKTCSRWLMRGIKPQVDPHKNIPDVMVSFLKHLDVMIRKNGEFYLELRRTNRLNIRTTMYCRNTSKSFLLDDGSIDLIITSPPYVTSYEYADLHQLTLLWFGDDHGGYDGWGAVGHDFTDFRKQFIGTSFKATNDAVFDSKIAEEIVSKIKLVDRSLASDVANYFSDMRRVFLEMFRVLKKDGKACIIIGDTTLKGVEILNAEVAAEQMYNAGFRYVKFIKREVINKSIAPWRDGGTGKFTNLDNPAKKRIYGCEYVIVMKK